MELKHLLRLAGLDDRGELPWLADNQDVEVPASIREQRKAETLDPWRHSKNAKTKNNL